MYKHSDRFIYYDELWIVVDDIQMQLFGHHRILPVRIEMDLDKIVFTQPITPVFEPAVDLAFPLFHQSAQIEFAERAKAIKEQVFQPLPVFIRPDLYLNSSIHC